MNRLRRTVLPEAFVVAITIILGIFASVVSIFISQGISTNFNTGLFAILATVGGGLIAALISLLIYRQNVSKGKRQPQQLESAVQEQKEEFLRLSEQELELEKQRTNLEKQQQTLLWLLAAAERIDDDPRLAIVIAYQGLEAEIQNLITRVYRIDIDDTRQEFSVSYNYDMLENYVGPDRARTIMQMRDLRNRIVHGEVTPKEIIEDKVRNYVQNAGHIAQEISQIEQPHEA